MTTQTQQKVYSYDDLIQDICKDPAGIHNLGHGTTQGYLRKDGKFIRRDRQTGKNKVYDFGKDFANSYGKLQGFDKNGMAPISILRFFSTRICFTRSLILNISFYNFFRHITYSTNIVRAGP